MFVQDVGGYPAQGSYPSSDHGMPNI